MASRHFPVRPNLDQLKHQAKELLRAVRRNEPQAIANFREYFPEVIDPPTAKLADAQFVLARSYGLPHWPRLVIACQMTMPFGEAMSKQFARLCCAISGSCMRMLAA
jgi:hypothetical protein